MTQVNSTGGAEAMLDPVVLAEAVKFIKTRWGLQVQLLVCYLVLLVEAAGEGNPTGLHAGVGVGTLKVDVPGPVLVVLYSTALELKTGNCGYSLPVGHLTCLFPLSSG